MSSSLNKSQNFKPRGLYSSCPQSCLTSWVKEPMLRLCTYVQNRRATELRYTWVWLWTEPAAGKACKQWLELSLLGTAAKGPGASVPGAGLGEALHSGSCALLRPADCSGTS